MKELSTDLQRDFKDFPDNREFAKQMLIYWISGFCLGAMVATVLIYFFMSLID